MKKKVITHQIVHPRRHRRFVSIEGLHGLLQIEVVPTQVVRALLMARVQLHAGECEW